MIYTASILRFYEVICLGVLVTYWRWMLFGKNDFNPAPISDIEEFLWISLGKMLSYKRFSNLSRYHTGLIIAWIIVALAPWAYQIMCSIKKAITTRKYICTISRYVLILNLIILLAAAGYMILNVITLHLFDVLFDGMLITYILCLTLTLWDLRQKSVYTKE